MFNTFILSSLTLEEVMAMNQIAEDSNLELSEEQNTIALFDSSFSERKRYKKPVVMGLIEVTDKLIDVNISNFNKSLISEEIFLSNKNILIDLQSKLLTNVKQVI